MQEALLRPPPNIESLPLVHALFQCAEGRSLSEFSYRPHQVHALTFESERLWPWLLEHKDNLRVSAPDGIYPIEARVYDGDQMRYAALRHDSRIYLLESHRTNWRPIVHCYVAARSRSIWEAVAERVQTSIARLSSLHEACRQSLALFEHFKAEAIAIAGSEPYLGIEILEERLVRDLRALMQGSEGVSPEADTTVTGFAKSTDFPKSLWLDFFGDEGDAELALPAGRHVLQGADGALLYLGLNDGRLTHALVVGPGRIYEFTDAVPSEDYSRTAICRLAMVEAWPHPHLHRFDPFHERIKQARSALKNELTQLENDLTHMDMILRNVSGHRRER